MSWPVSFWRGVSLARTKFREYFNTSQSRGSRGTSDDNNDKNNDDVNSQDALRSTVVGKPGFSNAYTRRSNLLRNSSAPTDGPTESKRVGAHGRPKKTDAHSQPGLSLDLRRMSARTRPTTSVTMATCNDSVSAHRAPAPAPLRAHSDLVLARHFVGGQARRKVERVLDVVNQHARALGAPRARRQPHRNTRPKRRRPASSGCRPRRRRRRRQRLHRRSLLFRL